MHVQSTNNTHAMNALRMYPDGRSAAIVLMAADEPDLHRALKRVFEIHEAPHADLESGVPWGADDVGDCVMTPDGAVITVEGEGRSFMGMRFVATWGTVVPSWRREARANGCIWLGLPERHGYDAIVRSVVSGSDTRLPLMPVLKLEVIPDGV